VKTRFLAFACATFTLAIALGLLLKRPAALELKTASAAAAATPSSATPSSELSLYQFESVFTTDDGRTVHLADLRGHFQILALIFTRCPRACPTLVKQLQALERALPAKQREATRFALVTIDPEHDTPQVLREYRTRMGLGEHWTLLNGAAESVRELAASIGFAYRTSEDAAPVHSKLVTVLDPQGAVVHQQVGLENDRQTLIDALARGAP
jgi:protein SCO1